MNQRERERKMLDLVRILNDLRAEEGKQRLTMERVVIPTYRNLFIQAGKASGLITEQEAEDLYQFLEELAR